MEGGSHFSKIVFKLMHYLVCQAKKDRNMDTYSKASKFNNLKEWTSKKIKQNSLQI